MKRLLAKFRISNALDRESPLPPSFEQSVARSDELREFRQEATDLDQAFREERGRSQVEPPGWLHESIMREVTAIGRSSARASSIPLPRWALVGAVAILLALIMGGVFLPPFGGARKADLPASEAWLLGLGGSEVARIAPAVLGQHMSDEIENIEKDLRASVEFVMASLP